MLKDRGKKAVVIIVNGERYVLQEPCRHCHGGQFVGYSPKTSTGVGPCLYCNDGLVDTPLFAAIKQHLGVQDELKGFWMGKGVLDGASLMGPGLPRIASVNPPLHFYPDDWRDDMQYNRALCAQGLDRRQASIDESGNEEHCCKNCLRIKKAKESEPPVVYEKQT